MAGLRFLFHLKMTLEKNTPRENSHLEPKNHPNWKGKSSETNLHGCFRKWWYPRIIHFNRVFHYRPSITPFTKKSLDIKPSPNFPGYSPTKKIPGDFFGWKKIPMGFPDFFVDAKKQKRQKFEIQQRWDPKEQPSLVYNGFGNPTQARLVLRETGDGLVVFFGKDLFLGGAPRGNNQKIPWGLWFCQWFVCLNKGKGRNHNFCRCKNESFLCLDDMFFVVVGNLRFVFSVQFMVYLSFPKYLVPCEPTTLHF